MNQGQYSKLFSFLWNIANDVLVDAFNKGDYKDIIMPMLVLRRIDVLLEPTKEKVLQQKKQLDDFNVVHQDQLLCMESGYPFYNTSRFTLKTLISETDPQRLRINFIDYINGYSENVLNVFEKLRLRAQIDFLTEQGRLGSLIQKFTDSTINLSVNPVLDDEGNELLPGLDNHTMGTIFVELLRKFNEENNVTEAGERFTPREYVELLTNLAVIQVKHNLADDTPYAVNDATFGAGSKPKPGYSIKSKLGGGSYLINSNKNESNFIFKIEGINDSQMAHINTLDKFKKKFDYIKEVGGSWSFVEVAGATLKQNLLMLDLGMARIVGECLAQYYSGSGSSLADICRVVTTKDPLHICNADGQPMYEYKLRQFLLAFALGMTVSSPWYGMFHANGGYIVVKEDGDIICYHFFDRNDLEGYLFNNTKFDTPSTTRHCFGEVYKELDSYFIKLNLQVRFK